MTTKIFHFTLGPVQGFVAQARRTRDLWAGSFLLSWLAGHAMQEVIEQGGEIVFPKVTDANGKAIDPLLRAIQPDFTNGNRPQIGSLPNRFKARVPDGFKPAQVVRAVEEQWQALAEAVYECFVEAVETKGKNTRQIWERQIGNFWEINWVIGEEPAERGADDRWLDRRKNWRSHWPEPEGGDHCTIMGDYQELSGYVRAKEKTAQDDFWQAIRNTAPDDYLDIRENERLCAIALVKRLFPRLGGPKLEVTIGWIPGGNEKAVGNWPSTTYMAIAPWLAGMDDDGLKKLNKYACTAQEEIGAFFAKLVSEQATHLATLKRINEQPLCDSTKWKLDDLDGDLLHIHALRNYRNTYLSERPLDANGKDNNAPSREKLVQALSELYQAVGRKPRSYYALLLMDGDNLGRMLRTEDPQKVSSALLDFTNSVRPCVDGDPRFGGVTIYAGGDDVFALLPMDTAIACAMALRDLFGQSFSKQGIDASASCAIVFAHHQAPLRQVIHEAHHQLDDIAKDANGRDSLALAVYKPGGVTAQWVSAWQVSPSPVARVTELIGAMTTDEKAYPRGLFHKLRDRYGLYDNSNVSSGIGPDDLRKLLIAEYMQTRDPAPSVQQAEAAVDRLLDVCLPLSRDPHGQTRKAAALRMEGGLIARFLTQEED
jgi:CRISPR-associated protein Cmr2